MSATVFAVGMLIGVWGYGLYHILTMITEKELEEDKCSGCFGAANGDCDECRRREEENDKQEKQ